MLKKIKNVDNLKKHLNDIENDLENYIKLNDLNSIQVKNLKKQYFIENLNYNIYFFELVLYIRKEFILEKKIELKDEFNVLSRGKFYINDNDYLEALPSNSLKSLHLLTLALYNLNNFFSIPEQVVQRISKILNFIFLSDKFKYQKKEILIFFISQDTSLFSTIYEFLDEKIKKLLFFNFTIHLKQFNKFNFKIELFLEKFSKKLCINCFNSFVTEQNSSEIIKLNDIRIFQIKYTLNKIKKSSYEKKMEKLMVIESLITKIEDDKIEDASNLDFSSFEISSGDQIFYDSNYCLMYNCNKRINFFLEDILIKYGQKTLYEIIFRTFKNKHVIKKIDEKKNKKNEILKKLKHFSLKKDKNKILLNFSELFTIEYDIFVFEELYLNLIIFFLVFLIENRAGEIKFDPELILNLLLLFLIPEDTFSGKYSDEILKYFSKISINRDYNYEEGFNFYIKTLEYIRMVIDEMFVDQNMIFIIQKILNFLSHEIIENQTKFFDNSEFFMKIEIILEKMKNICSEFNFKIKIRNIK